MAKKEEEIEKNNEKVDKAEDLESKRQPCEVFSRVVGYLRPVHQWNPGKQSEFKDRRMLKLDEKDKEKGKKKGKKKK